MQDVKKAAVALGLSEADVRALMEQKAINIGYIIHHPKRTTYRVIPELLRREVSRRAADGNEQDHTE